MADSELRPIYLLTGGDRPKILRALERLRARFGPESVETMDAETVGGEEAVAACNSLGLFSGGRLVVVEGVEQWKKEESAREARIRTEAVKLKRAELEKQGQRPMPPGLPV